MFKIAVKEALNFTRPLATGFYYFDKKIINGKITYNDFREVTAMFNTDSKKYSYFSLRDDYILLNGENDIVDDFDFEKDYLNKLKK